MKWHLACLTKRHSINVVVFEHLRGSEYVNVLKMFCLMNIY